MKTAYILLAKALDRNNLNETLPFLSIYRSYGGTSDSNGYQSKTPKKLQQTQRQVDEVNDFQLD